MADSDSAVQHFSATVKFADTISTQNGRKVFLAGDIFAVNFCMLLYINVFIDYGDFVEVDSRFHALTWIVSDL